MMVSFFKRFFIRKSTLPDIPYGLLPIVINDDKGRKIWVYVSPDYYKENGMYLPVSRPEALEIANTMGLTLPTVPLVDSIWKQANIKLEPIFMPPDRSMTTHAAFIRHDEAIKKQLEFIDTNNKIIAGHKKDLIRKAKPGRCAIYGWHMKDGKPVQPYSNVHHEDYRDYSHGLRLIYPYGFVDNNNNDRVIL